MSLAYGPNPALSAQPGVDAAAPKAEPITVEPPDETANQARYPHGPAGPVYPEQPPPDAGAAADDDDWNPPG